MSKIAFFLLLLLSQPGFSQISSVSSGEAIQAVKLNEIISKINALELELVEAKQGIVPVATVISVPAICPSGYIEADGRSLVRSSYVKLFNAIGTRHGTASATTFNIPDYRGRFLRGVDGTAGQDLDKNTRSAMNPGGATGNTIGSIQADLIKEHNHGLPYPRNTGADIGGGPSTNYSSQREWAGGTTLHGGSETRPKNAYINFCIKTE